MKETNGKSYHDFKDSYEFAEAGKCEPFWDAIYKKAFPNLINHMRGADYACVSQSNGIDRIIFLDNGKTVTIDEKVRSKHWPDFALEYVSNDKTGSAGWIEKDLAIDYLAYAFLDKKQAYLLDWNQLKRAWLYWKDDWKLNYHTISAPNKHYNTLSVCVPIDVLLGAINRSSLIQL